MSNNKKGVTVLPLHSSPCLQTWAARALGKNQRDLFDQVQKLLEHHASARFGWEDLEDQRCMTKGKRKKAPSKKDRRIMEDKVADNIMKVLHQVVTIMEIRADVIEMVYPERINHLVKCITGEVVVEWDRGTRRGQLTTWEPLRWINVKMGSTMTTVGEILDFVYRADFYLDDKLDHLRFMQPLLNDMFNLKNVLHDNSVVMQYYFGSRKMRTQCEIAFDPTDPVDVSEEHYLYSSGYFW